MRIVRIVEENSTLQKEVKLPETTTDELIRRLRALTEIHPLGQEVNKLLIAAANQLYTLADQVDQVQTIASELSQLSKQIKQQE